MTITTVAQTLHSHFSFLCDDPSAWWHFTHTVASIGYVFGTLAAIFFGLVIFARIVTA